MVRCRPTREKRAPVTGAVGARVARAVRAARAAAQLTQAELAERAGVMPKNISEIENQSGNPTLITVERITGALGLSVTVQGAA